MSSLVLKFYTPTFWCLKPSLAAVSVSGTVKNNDFGNLQPSTTCSYFDVRHGDNVIFFTITNNDFTPWNRGLNYNHTGLYIAETIAFIALSIHHVLFGSEIIQRIHWPETVIPCKLKKTPSMTGIFSMVTRVSVMGKTDASRLFRHGRH